MTDGGKHSSLQQYKIKYSQIMFNKKGAYSQHLTILVTNELAK